MFDVTDKKHCLTPSMRLAHRNINPISTIGAVPILDQRVTVESYREQDNGILEAVPAAFTAYVDYHQRQWV